MEVLLRLLLKYRTMKFTRFVSTLLLCCLWLGCASCSSSKGSPPDAEQGYVSLYNGENLDGWAAIGRTGGEEMGRRVFTPGENGEMHVYRDFPDGYQLDSGKNDTHGLMITKKKYSRYSFKFEYKWGSKRLNNFGSLGYDAGMFYHVGMYEIWPTSIEYQVRYTPETNYNHTGHVLGLGGATFQWSAGPAGTYLAEEDGGKKQASAGGEHKGHPGAPFHGLDGQWNECEVIVMGNDYAIHKLNGVVVNVITDISLREGAIALQSETAEIFYRNIRIKEFDEDIPASAFLK